MKYVIFTFTNPISGILQTTAPRIIPDNDSQDSYKIGSHLPISFRDAVSGWSYNFIIVSGPNLKSTEGDETWEVCLTLKSNKEKGHLVQFKQNHIQEKILFPS